MIDSKNYIGQLVTSKAGRDKGKIFIVLSVLNDKYVYVCDGSLRATERPKKKKIKHLVFTNLIAEEIRNLLMSDGNVTNSMVKKFLQSYDNSKEV